MDRCPDHATFHAALGGCVCDPGYYRVRAQIRCALRRFNQSPTVSSLSLEEAPEITKIFLVCSAVVSLLLFVAVVSIYCHRRKRDTQGFEFLVEEQPSIDCPKKIDQVE